MRNRDQAIECADHDTLYDRRTHRKADRLSGELSSEEDRTIHEWIPLYLILPRRWISDPRDTRKRCSKWSKTRIENTLILPRNIYNLSMQTITFITGNQKKVDYMRKLLGMPIEHIKLDLDEIQSLDLKEVVEHKVRQAYEKIWKPVLVDDVSFEFCALGRIPGTFVKHFVDEMWLDRLASLVDERDRSGIARCMFWYFDWVTLRFFEWVVEGTVAEKPEWENGFGWDRIFITWENAVPNACLDDEWIEKFFRKLRPVDAFKEFLLTR